MHILLIAYAFPPSGEIGARRALRFARSLPHHGFPVSVLTAQARFYPIVDPSREVDLGGLTVVRTTTMDPIARMKAARGSAGSERSGEMFPLASGPLTGSASLRSRAVRVASRCARAFLLPDPEVGWATPATNAARRLHAEHPIDIVMVTVPPYSAVLAGVLLSRSTGARLVLDYRDPWAADRELRPRGFLYELVSSRIERAALRRARLALFTSERARDFYRQRFPFLARAEVLLNGIDQRLPQTVVASGPPLTWVHAGSLYDGRSLLPVVEAMAALRSEVTLRLVLIGDQPQAELRRAEELGIAGAVEWIGRLPYDKTAARLRSAHRLVGVVSEHHPFSIPAKIFDYMASSRPALLLARPDHPAARLVAGIDGWRVVASDDREAIMALAREDDRALREGTLGDVPRAATEPFEAEAQIRSLAGWLSEI